MRKLESQKYKICKVIFLDYETELFGLITKMEPKLEKVTFV